MSRVLVVLLVVACTKPNPARTCHDGTCTDSMYPFCDADGAVGGEPNTCIAVTCTAGSVFECRSDGALVCNATGDNYDVMACPAGCVDGIGCNGSCTRNTDCSSGVCATTGVCALESEIAYTSPAAQPGASCSRTDPCTLDNAVASSKHYISLAEGDYRESATVVLAGTRVLVGQGAASTRVRITPTDQNVFRIDTGADVTLESMTIRDALQMPTGGVAVECPSTPTGPRKLRVADVSFTNNNLAGVFATDCDVSVIRSTDDGGTFGVHQSGGTLVLDQCEFSAIATPLLAMSTTGLDVTNSFFIRSTPFGPAVQLASPTGSFSFEFNTIVDNPSGGIDCEAVNASLANNIIARNGSNGSGNVSGDASCTTPGSLISSTVTALKFVSPDSPPYDYHLTTGSSAVDAAVNGSLDHDVDGDHRPSGSGWDVGADEL